MAHNIAVELTKRGHVVTTLASWYGLQGPKQEDTVWRTLQFVAGPRLDLQRPKWQQLALLYQFYKGFHNKANAQEIQRAIAVCQPDVIYVREVTGLGVNSLLQVMQGLHIPIVFHQDSYWLQYMHTPETELSHLRLPWLKKLLIGPVPAFPYTSLIAASETIKQKYIAIGCKAESIETIYHGIDSVFTDTPHVMQEATSHKNITRLLFVGRISVEKGILVLCKALDILINREGRRGLHLDIVGTGDQSHLKEIRSYLEEKQLTHVVTFHGKVQPTELLPYYDHADIMLVPSIWQEPFGLVVAEAMARGLAVIASRVGGPAEIITHEKDGFLVIPDNAESLAEAIKRLVTDQELRTYVAHNAQKTVLERFTLEKCARLVEHHLQHQVETFSGCKV